MYQLTTDNVIKTTKLLQTSPLWQLYNSARTREFLKRVQAVTWDRRFVRLGDSSRGLVPGTAYKEGQICLLFGCDVPVVLRPVFDDYWEFIGEAFVHGRGVMEGEVVNRAFEEVVFNIV
jgi:hypothetical protein